MQNGCEPWCEDHCDGVTVRLEPDAVFEHSWSGLLWEDAELRCDGCAAQCSLASAAPAGTYRVELTVHDRCTPSFPGDCDCVAEADGTCEIWGAGLANDGGTAIATEFDFPTAEPVDLVLLP